jgi:hypothetical protein
VIECAATARVEIEIVAVPPLSELVASAVEPSMKVPLPVGVPLSGATAVTVAVNVTDSPKTEGFTDEVTLLVVADSLTIRFRGPEVLVTKLPSPLYETEIVC